MKKLIMLAALAGFGIAGAVEQTVINIPSPLLKPTDATNYKVENNFSNLTNLKNDELNISYTSALQLSEAFFTYAFSENTVMQYYPEIKTTAIITNKRKFVGTSLDGTTISVLTSADNGVTWKETIIHETTQYYLGRPSFSAHTNGKTDPKEWDIYVYGTNYPKPNFNFADFRFITKNGSNPIVDQTFSGPEDNNPGYQYKWDEIKFTPFSKGANKYVAGVGQTQRPANTTIDFSKYAFMNWSFTDENFLKSGLPTAFSNSNFTGPDPNAAAGSYNGAINLDADSEGNLYTVMAHYFPDDNTARVTAVAKSTNLGESWADFTAMKMPSNILSTYIRSKFSNPTDNIRGGSYGNRPYEQNGFAVYGNNKFSQLIRITSLNETTNQGLFELVEVNFDNGVWSINPVTELTSAAPFLILRNSSTNAKPNRFTLIRNPQGNEVQLSKTADGQYLVAKWLDVDTVRGLLPLGKPTYLYYTPEGQNATESLERVDTLQTTDVFMAYKKVGDKNWSRVYNVTNDLAYNKFTRIPAIVPSITEIPLMTLATNEASFNPSATSADSALIGANTIIKQMVSSQEYGAFLRTAKVNATTTSVQDENPVYSDKMTLSPVFPNPVAEQAEISFSLFAPADVKLVILNQVGEVVKEVISSRLMNSGTHGVTVDTKELPNGVYFYTLTAGAKSLTKSMTVVR